MRIAMEAASETQNGLEASGPKYSQSSTQNPNRKDNALNKTRNRRQRLRVVNAWFAGLGVVVVAVSMFFGWHILQTAAMAVMTVAIVINQARINSSFIRDFSR